MKNDIHDVGLVLDSRCKLIVIESWDELRVLQMLRMLALKRGLNLRTWSVTDGLQGGLLEAGNADESTQEPDVALRLIRADRLDSLYVMCDVHPYLEASPKIVRAIKDIAINEHAHSPTLILLSHALKLPPELQRHATRFSVSLPSEDELLAIVRDEASRWSERNQGVRVRTDNLTLAQVVKNLRGLSHAEARSLARTLICDDGAITQDDLPLLNKAKFQLLNFDGVLSFESDTARFAQVGGLAKLKHWLNERQSAFRQAQGSDWPKGMLLVGVQGGGKSLAAKAVAGLWGLPLLRLDMGGLYNKYFGETERNLREALHMAEQMAPCVLWIDEIEKGLATSDSDEGVSQRLLGTFLTWMAERKVPVFMVATANAIDRLPPELVRKGRFDELFFVDLPQASVREEIFVIHLTRRELDPQHYDLAVLAQASEGFSGAEIEQVVVSALYSAQARQSRVDQSMLLETLRTTSPLSVVMAEKLAALRAWADGRAVRAD